MELQPGIDNQSSNRNEQPGAMPNDPADLPDTPDANKITDWSKEPSLEELKGDLEFAREQTNDQTTNVNGWLDLRNATGAEAPS